MKNKALLGSALSALMVAGSVVPAFAADSPQDPTVNPGEIQNVTATATAPTGEKLELVAGELPAETKEVLNNETAVEDIIAAAGFDVTGKDYTYTVVTSGEYELMVNGQKPVDFTFPAEGIDFTFDLAGADLKDGATVYVLHQLKSGTWEVKEATVKGGKVTANFTSLSPIAIVKVMSDGTVVTLPAANAGTPAGKPGTTTTGKPAASTTAASTNTVKKSPSTGV